MSGMQNKAVFIGSTQVLIDCVRQWLAAGHAVESVISDCPDVATWLSSTDIRLVSAKQDLVQALSGVAFDYLFSIINHAILPDELLALPKQCAINYHDSALPDYAGFNATSWAIIEGANSHGVTWHAMTAEVDGGDILLQKTFGISAEDTAFSLGVKCANACRESFADLLIEIEAGTLSGEAMAPKAESDQGGFHLRSDRPGVGVIDFNQSAVAISRFVRGLHLGREDNWMCLPKLQIGETFYLVDHADLVPSEAASEPGRVLNAHENTLTVAATDGGVRLSGLTRLDGRPLDTSELSGAVNRTLSSLTATQTQLADFDTAQTKHERFWVRRVAEQSAPVLAQLREASQTPVKGQFSINRRHGAQDYLAALSVYIACAGEASVFDLALSTSLPEGADAFYATSVPLRVDVDQAAPFDAVRRQVGSTLELIEKRGTFARDMRARYERLRDLPSTVLTLPIGIQLDGAPDLLPDSALTLHVTDTSDVATFSYDRNAISEAAVLALAARVETLLVEAGEQPESPISQLNLLPEDEKRQLLERSRGSVKSYDKDRCVHQLFEAQVDRTPDATAVEFQGHSLTYRALDLRANQIANTLISKGVVPGDFVAVCVKRSTELVAALLGVMKAGAAYVPMDPSYPQDRLSIMLEDSQAKVLLTETGLAGRLPAANAEMVTLNAIAQDADASAPHVAVNSDHLAYIIFTSGSTGRPKGVKVAHRNVANFFAGMDDVIGTEPGVWLAVTSVSFDISVLEIFWTLARGFEVIIQGETDQSSLADAARIEVSDTPMDFGLFYFSSSQGDARPGETYKVLLEGAKFADANGFQSVWTPERHFHEFGGIFPNPAVTTAALATITENVALRAGSVVLPMHNPIRVAEDWSMIDQLSNGRVGLSFASGWHANDFALMPENYERRREIMVESIDTVFKLWAGEEVEVANGEGERIKVSTFPRPIQERPPIWIASAGNIETFKAAGRLGANILTNMLGQDLDDLRTKLAAYREARADAGFDGPGQVSLMLHTYVCENTEQAREIAREPFCNYLQSSFDLVKVAPWMFPAFKRPSLDGAEAQLDTSQFTDDDIAALMDHAFDRYFETAGLFGAPEHALGMVEKLKAIGVNEIACLVDFGIESDLVLDSLPHLNRLRELAHSGRASADENAFVTVGETFKTHEITHLQCTPSMARMLIDDPDILARFGSLKHLMLGGEALPSDLADQLHEVLTGQFTNMYGPTETTIWSTTAPVIKGEPITIGRPIANTTIRLLDAGGNMVGLGESGELCIGGDGVVPGYLGRDDLTAERFVDDPYAPGERLYRTGDLARYKASGELEYLGRMDQQVKLNGYRIELGEIETQLSRHPDIWQSVVAAHTENGVSQLVAYYASSQGQEGDVDLVDHWQGLWDAAYLQSDDDREARFNFSGWNDSYTGAPIPEIQMREWRDATQRTILDLDPRKVLEIGCGTGMVLFSVLDQVEHYTGIDVSANALERIGEELTPAEQSKVALRKMSADAIGQFEAGRFDTVVINSVAQYFPNADYLVDVLTRAADLVADGGQIFIGDVRSLEQLTAFHTAVELHQAPAHLDAAALNSRIAKRLQRESELLLGEDFFHALLRDVPRLQGLTVTLKRGTHANEMTDYRYDVVLHVGSEAVEVLELPAPQTAETLADVETLLAEGAPVILLQGLNNARLLPIYSARAVLDDRACTSAADLRGLLEHERESGVDPDSLFGLHSDYQVAEMRFNRADPSAFDVVLCHTSQVEKRVAPNVDMPSLKTARAYANQPAAQAGGQSQLADQLRAHLREHLPDYMIPSAFVAMDAFPLTPNGKIDRNALPAPTAIAEPEQTAYVPPSNALETTIAGIWMELLGLAQVGRSDNIFDIGANSIMTAQANQRLSKALGRRVSLVSMFRYPTVEALAAYLGEETSGPATKPVETARKPNRREEAAAKRRAKRREQVE
nr:MupA/Atu3671 family FMN-dependent luciferase-like monooxygenase [Hyphomonas sp. Mor2]